MRASLKLIGINLLFSLLLLFASSIFANQIIFDKSELNNDFNNKKYISEIGDEKNLNFLNLFNKKESKDIENLLSIIPTKNSNPVVQDLIYEIANKGFNLYAGPGSEVDGGFEHSGFFALVDDQGMIRSRYDQYGNPIIYYDGLELNQVSKLIDDISVLLKEDR